MKLQNKIFGIDTREAYERLLREEDSDKNKKPEFQLINARANINQQDYIRVPNTDTLISRAEQHKGLDWNNAHYNLADNGLFMPTPALFLPYFVNVRDATQGKITLYTADNKPVPRDEAEDLWKYLSSGHRGGCWTWLDAQFQKLPASSDWGVELDHRVDNTGNEKKLIGNSGFLEDCLREDCYVDLEFNLQGLPVRRSSTQSYKQGENIHYYHPRDEKVVGFVADSVWVDLYCVRNPGNSYSALGVFACAVGAPEK